MRSRTKTDGIGLTCVSVSEGRSWRKYTAPCNPNPRIPYKSFPVRTPNLFG